MPALSSATRPSEGRRCRLLHSLALMHEMQTGYQVAHSLELHIPPPGTRTPSPDLILPTISDNAARDLFIDTEAASDPSTPAIVGGAHSCDAHANTQEDELETHQPPAGPQRRPSPECHELALAVSSSPAARRLSRAAFWNTTTDPHPTGY